MTLKKQEWVPLFYEFIKYIRINSKEVAAIDKLGAPLDLWPSQKMAINSIVEGMERGAHTFMMGKSRQLGISTIIETLDIFWLAIHPGMMGAYVIDKEKNLPAIRDKIKRYFNSFPPGFFGRSFKIESDNKEFMLFSNGSRLDFLTAGVGKKETHWGEGKGYAFAHLTEVAKYGNAEGLASFRATLSEANPDRLFIYESTSKGFNHWRDMWEEFGEDEFRKRRLFCGWWGNPFNIIKKDSPAYSVFGAAEPDQIEQELIDKVKEDYGFSVSRQQLAWYRQEHKSTTSLAALHQNYPWTIEQSFVATGYSFFQQGLLQEEMERCRKIPYKGYKYIIGNDFWSVVCECIYDENRKEEITLRIWEEPDDDATYVIGCDPAHGRDEHNDRHCISVFRCFGDKIVQVAEYADNETGTRQAAWVLAHLAGAYKNCLSEDSEILTKFGWKKYSEISIGDEVVGFSLSSGEYQWEKIEDVIIKNYNGDMYHFQSDGLDQLVTPEHRMIMRHDPYHNKGNWKVRTALDISKMGNHANYIPKGGCPIGDGIPDLSLDMCRVLGWLITDGCRRKYEIILSQGKFTNKDGKNICNEIDNILPNVCKFSRYEVGAKNATKECVRWVIRGDNKRKLDKWLCDDDIHKIPRRFINEMSENQLKAFFQGLLEGDGGWFENTKSYSLFCPGHSINLAEGFQEIALKLGYSTTLRYIQTRCANGKLGKPQIIVRLTNRKSHSFRPKSVIKEQYAGKVWCVSVASGAFVMRRNGKVSVTGNCVVNVEAAPGPGGVIMNELENLRERMRIDAKFDAAENKIDSWDDFLSNARWYLYKKPDHFAPGFVKGWESNWKTKVQIMEQLRDKYVTECIIIRSKPLVEEMMDVIRDGDSIGAPESAKDDRVIALALCNRAWIDSLMMPLLSQGETYEQYMRVTNGEPIDKSVKLMNNIVSDFFKNAEEKADIVRIDPHKQWLYDRGFI